jgi:hypothetical protein
MLDIILRLCGGEHSYFGDESLPSLLMGVCSRTSHTYTHNVHRIKLFGGYVGLYLVDYCHDLGMM